MSQNAVTVSTYIYASSVHRPGTSVQVPSRLVYFSMNTSTALIHRDQRSHERQRQLIKGSLSDPAPGRTLNQIYSNLGNFLERQANRVAHRRGHGPSAIADHIAAYFGTDQQRAVKLDELHAGACSCRELELECSKLAKYTLPCESARTQIQAFHCIIATITRYHGTRVLFLNSKHLRRVGNTEAAIVAVWARADDTQPCDWDRHCELAAASLFEKDISAILGDISPGSLGCVDTGSNCLSVIERLLIASECSMDSTSGVIAQRYLTGILELPAFWQGSAPIYTDIFSKILQRLFCVLNDLGLELDDHEESTNLNFDNEGIDSFASAVLIGVSGWYLTNPESWGWYHNLCEIVRLLRLPESERHLSKSSALAVGAEIKRIVPDTGPTTVVRLTLANDVTGILPMHADRISLRSLGDALDDSPVQFSGVGPQHVVYTDVPASFRWTSVRREFSRFLSWSAGLRKKPRAPKSPRRSQTQYATTDDTDSDAQSTVSSVSSSTEGLSQEILQDDHSGNPTMLSSGSSIQMTNADDSQVVADPSRSDEPLEEISREDPPPASGGGSVQMLGKQEQEDIIEVNAHLNSRLLEKLDAAWGICDPPHPLSETWDSDWGRLRKRAPDTRLRPFYVPGTLTGLWQGRILIPAENHLNALVSAEA
ncbi:Catabolite degradation [Mycena sanguinolenta]|uniref:Catabolite degradation n=1 Tax=Mycena sanguinolenta TaxID=230812 RepID=A0A8H6ZIE8_9AGAR|nr:Catabolite degradation [Mycena sanguinolenta]